MHNLQGRSYLSDSLQQQNAQSEYCSLVCVRLAGLSHDVVDLQFTVDISSKTQAACQASIPIAVEVWPNNMLVTRLEVRSNPEVATASKLTT